MFTSDNSWTKCLLKCRIACKQNKQINRNFLDIQPLKTIPAQSKSSTAPFAGAPKLFVVIASLADLFTILFCEYFVKTGKYAIINSFWIIMFNLADWQHCMRVQTFCLNYLECLQWKFCKKRNKEIIRHSCAHFFCLNTFKIFAVLQQLLLQIQNTRTKCLDIAALLRNQNAWTKSLLEIKCWIWEKVLLCMHPKY